MDADEQRGIEFLLQIRDGGIDDVVLCSRRGIRQPVLRVEMRNLAHLNEHDALGRAGSNAFGKLPREFPGDRAKLLAIRQRLGCSPQPLEFR